MQAISKLVLIPPLIALACLAAGMYGMAHDQLSYTVSPEYFHHFKFDQFAIGVHMRNRVGAAIVGWGATWWMGLVVGLPLSLVGLVIPGRLHYAAAVCKSFALAIGTAAVLGLTGLVVARFGAVTDWLPGFALPEGVTDREAYLEVGVMHEASSSAGVGMVVGLSCLLVTGFRQRRERKAGGA